MNEKWKRTNNSTTVKLDLFIDGSGKQFQSNEKVRKAWKLKTSPITVENHVTVSISEALKRVLEKIYFSSHGKPWTNLCLYMSGGLFSSVVVL